MISKKLLVLFLLFGYSFTIVGEDVYAQRSKKSNSSRGNKSRSKSKKSSRSGSSAREDHSSSSANYEEENAVPMWRKPLIRLVQKQAGLSLRKQEES